MISVKKKFGRQNTVECEGELLNDLFTDLTMACYNITNRANIIIFFIDFSLFSNIYFNFIMFQILLFS